MKNLIDHVIVDNRIKRCIIIIDLLDDWQKQIKIILMVLEWKNPKYSKNQNV